MSRQGRADSAPAPTGRAVIHSTPLQQEAAGRDWSQLLPAWIISGVIHVALLSLFLLLTTGTTGAPVSTGEFVQINDVGDEDTRDKQEINDEEFGLNPLELSGRDVARTDEPTTPGKVDFAAAVGVLDPAQNALEVTPSPFGNRDGNDRGTFTQRDGEGTGRTGLDPGSPSGLPGKQSAFPGGSGATRQRLVERDGGSPRSEAAVARGLAWLARHQAGNGSWGLNSFPVAGGCNCGHHARISNDTAATALALLPFLAAGETHRSVGASSRYSKQIELGLKWLVEHQAADGQLGDGYAHPLAAIVLCEAYGLTSDSALKPHAERAIRKINEWQGPDGGFRYGPKQPGDLSVTGWHLQALTSAQLAGVGTSPATYRGVNQFLDRVASADGSQYGYTDGKSINPRMTAVGLLSRQYLGYGPRNRALIDGVESLKKLPPAATTRDMYYYYYATQVLHNLGGDDWDQWNVKMRDLLIETQDLGADAQHRDQRGSWSPEGDPFKDQMGRLGMTSLAVLTLEVYYRRLPLYRRQHAAQKDAAILQR